MTSSCTDPVRVMTGIVEQVVRDMAIQVTMINGLSILLNVALDHSGIEACSIQLSRETMSRRAATVLAPSHPGRS